MGMGDDIMFTAKFRNLKRKFPDQNFYPAAGGVLRWSEVYENNPHFSKTGTPVEIRSPIGERPYQKGPYFNKDARGTFTKLIPLYPEIGDIYLTQKEVDAAKLKFSLPEKFVTIDPLTKTDMYKSNRDWGFHKWQAVVDRFPDITFIQTSAGKNLQGDNVKLHMRASMREFFAVLSQAKFHIGNEGGPVHAATAMGKRCVAVFGGLSSPAATGYDVNYNHYVKDPESPCGRHYECDHCKRCMELITVDDVCKSVKELQNAHY